MRPQFSIGPTGQARTGWGQSGNLVTGDSNKTVSLQAQFETAAVFSVMIDITALPAHGCMPRVQIQYSINGNTIVRTIDCASAASMSGVAEAVRVVVSDHTPSSVNNHAETYGVTITVGLYPRPTSAIGPILTGDIAESIGNGGNHSYAVPPGANGVTILAYSSATLNLELLEKIGSAVLADIQVVADTVGQAFPLIAGTQTVEIINNGSAAADVAVIWNIDS